MLRIVEIHKSANARGEYIVLQNLGHRTVSLRGHVLCADSFLCKERRDSSHDHYVFPHDVPVKPTSRVVLFTGEGEDGWRPTTDGKYAYVAYWNRAEPVWTPAEEVHLLHVSSTRSLNPVKLVGIVGEY